ncbi:hypothetical protein A3F07_00995 [candidate division WWE3 bacterium RIFCSPHIGHO2_12_FULL_38_15]|uniref:Bacterial sugar transferase domain-containing protein n=1 Tax=candidate division WWE3 bacterium RIFCSPHIGHO2_02_FULL_38_14 TaxID=1802620 RepID=A0A1F4VA73_UNCKA|nr:MAG: hypothetical protein A2793_03805 [candidate division WWE3 bacterium RIFCSPHIGHO2_01_FULL_38_45]OGC49151.1 MAG: hypothetical protein A3F07_00995 [candidate division WWE3 bacterium RIFCSPHIGHO2_12_FULL_38_15]OGC52583.1 MAG: hypothetical protein A3B64_03410 [candidate division WWE3 bacterium RIFCSPLOWO2_01_FULL_37_24]OGC54074.1 MAG: hypothetical protein A3D91_04935 [candidate division WWE3 bacterium RIFCSPHIGHO2_02_FULL_38_14]HLB51754.1 sugar transferase [Patescibacteria group bacterium]
MPKTDVIDFYSIGKRLIDIFGAIVGIILFVVPMLLTTVWIKMVSSEGPVLADMKKRVGKKGIEFRMFKFRSMRPNAQEWLRNQPDLYRKYQENDYKLDPDPRLIKGAAFLRKLSIDELPQFFNIFIGDMSLVGPRAYFRYELDEQLLKYPEAIEYINKAITVKPGLTGVWQTSGRSEIGFVERARLDADYASRRSLVYDLLIILKTPYVVLTKKGAL